MNNLIAFQLCSPFLKNQIVLKILRLKSTSQLNQPGVATAFYNASTLRALFNWVLFTSPL